MYTAEEYLQFFRVVSDFFYVASPFLKDIFLGCDPPLLSAHIGKAASHWRSPAPGKCWPEQPKDNDKDKYKDKYKDNYKDKYKDNEQGLQPTGLDNTSAVNTSTHQDSM